MTDLILSIVLVLVVCASIFFTWTLVGLIRSHVPFISTFSHIARRMVELAEIKPEQQILDLGCGRGVILFEVLRQHPELCSEIKMIGYELVRPVVWLAKIRKFFTRNRHTCSLQFQCVDFFKQDLSHADIIFCYLWPSVMDRFYAEKWSTLKKGARVISHGFPIAALQPQKIGLAGKTKIFVYEKCTL